MAAIAGCAVGHHHTFSSNLEGELKVSQQIKLSSSRSKPIGTQIAKVDRAIYRRVAGKGLSDLPARQPTRIFCSTFPLHSKTPLRSNLASSDANHLPSTLTKSFSSSFCYSRHSRLCINQGVSSRRNASVSLGFPLASDVDTWRLIVERVTVFVAILVAQFAGSAQPVWRLGLHNRVPLNPSKQSASEEESFIQNRSLSFATSADWGGAWGGEWDGASSSDSATSASERRATGESASTSDPADTEVPFPPRIWGDISDKLRAPLVARRGRQVETVLAKAPETSVQGLAREARRKLCSAALESLRRGVGSIPDSFEELDGIEWQNACEGVLVDAVSETRSAWLGETSGVVVPRKGVGIREAIVSQAVPLEEPVSAVETPADSNWVQNVFGLGGSKHRKVEVSPSTEGAETANTREAETSASQESETGRRFEFGGWAAPAFRTDEGTDSKLRRELPVELVLMEEKLPLYEELLFYLRFKTCRPDTRLPQGAFARFAPRALEDLILAVADAVASDCMSQVGYNPRKPVDSLTEETVNPPQKGPDSSSEGFADSEGLEAAGGSGAKAEAVGLGKEGSGLGRQTRRLAGRGLAGNENGLTSDENGLAEQSRQLERLMQRYLHPRLRSTRALERFRNEVSIRRFLRTKLSSVAAMYEDRYELWGLRRQPIAGRSEPLEAPKTKPGTPRRPKLFAGFSGLGFLGRKRQAEKADEDWEVVVVGQRMPCRRITELRKLSGWRLRYSMALEFLDVAAPVLNALLAKVGDWISFLLVRMIGRSLGLVYKGIKQSLKRP